jgi:hypothetical protein
MRFLQDRWGFRLDIWGLRKVYGDYQVNNEQNFDF